MGAMFRVQTWAILKRQQICLEQELADIWSKQSAARAKIVSIIKGIISRSLFLPFLFLGSLLILPEGVFLRFWYFAWAPK